MIPIIKEDKDVVIKIYQKKHKRHHARASKILERLQQMQYYSILPTTVFYNTTSA